MKRSLGGLFFALVVAACSSSNAKGTWPSTAVTLVFKQDAKSDEIVVARSGAPASTASSAWGAVGTKVVDDGVTLRAEYSSTDVILHSDGNLEAESPIKWWIVDSSGKELLRLECSPDVGFDVKGSLETRMSDGMYVLYVEAGNASCTWTPKGAFSGSTLGPSRLRRVGFPRTQRVHARRPDTSTTSNAPYHSTRELGR